MKDLSKLIIVIIFVFAGIAVSINGCAVSGNKSLSTAELSGFSPTPPVNANSNVNTAKPASPSATTASKQSDKTMKKEFTLAKDSLSEYGEVAFNHNTHAFQNYSPDGKSAIGCVECHHTDQPKANLKPPLVTSERDVVLTFETWKASDKKVTECRACHFQEGSVPDGKEMPVGAGGKELNNELAYHINCNTCHDQAAKLRPEVKKKPGFATTTDCTTCHKSS